MVDNRSAMISAYRQKRNTTVDTALGPRASLLANAGWKPALRQKIVILTLASIFILAACDNSSQPSAISSRQVAPG